MLAAEAPSPATAQVFAALGDGTRLRLVMTLSDGQSRSIATLSADARITRQGVTKHLRVLEEAGLVTSRRAGRESLYACRPEPIAQARAFLDQVAEHWDDALGRLKAHVEGKA
jgi:DNA-binding transcriptional ArsR family regulator